MLEDALGWVPGHRRSDGPWVATVPEGQKGRGAAGTQVSAIWMSGFIFKSKHLEGLSTVPQGRRAEPGGSAFWRLFPGDTMVAGLLSPRPAGWGVSSASSRPHPAPPVPPRSRPPSAGHARGVTAGSRKRGTWLRVSSRVCELRRLHPEPLPGSRRSFQTSAAASVNFGHC